MRSETSALPMNDAWPVGPRLLAPHPAFCRSSGVRIVRTQDDLLDGIWDGRIISESTLRSPGPSNGPNLPTKSWPQLNASAIKRSRLYAANFKFTVTR